MSVAVYASGLAFQATGPSGGVSCSFTFGVDHAVLLVGYNSTHWFIKNSWGPTWGNNGFGYISKINDCNLHTYIDVMQVDFGLNPNPSPNPNPPDAQSDKPPPSSHSPPYPSHPPQSPHYTFHTTNHTSTNKHATHYPPDY